MGTEVLEVGEGAERGDDDEQEVEGGGGEARKEDASVAPLDS